jgi:hypothetical protein
MTSGQDTNSKGHEPSENLKDPAQNKASQISTTADALSDSSLEDVSGGTWQFSPTARAANSVYGPGG